MTLGKSQPLSASLPCEMELVKPHKLVSHQSVGVSRHGVAGTIPENSFGNMIDFSGGGGGKDSIVFCGNHYSYWDNIARLLRKFL